VNGMREPGPALAQPRERRLCARLVPSDEHDAGAHLGKLQGGNLADA